MKFLVGALGGKYLVDNFCGCGYRPSLGFSSSFCPFPPFLQHLLGCQACGQRTTNSYVRILAKICNRGKARKYNFVTGSIKVF